MPISYKINMPVCDASPAGPVPTKRSYNLKWSKADLASYYFQSGKFLQSIVCLVSLLHCNPSCNCDSHQTIIDMYYTNIVNMLKCASSGSVPKLPFNCLKPFWSDDLDRLKTISIDMHALWRAIGSPRQGVINAARIIAKLDYKRAIKESAASFERDNADTLNRHLSDRKPNDFWKCWNAKYQRSLATPVAIGGQSDPITIANNFKDYYANIYIDSGKDRNALNDCNNNLA